MRPVFVKALACCALALPLFLAAGENKEPDQPKSAAFDPKKDMGKITVAPGFEFTLFAAPPDIGYPVCLCTSPQGDLFVAVDENGSLDRKPDRGRIIKCTDTKGDGKADKFTVFCKVDSPRGIFYDNGRLIVLHPPMIEAYYDDNGVGVANRHETLVTGLGFGLDARGADHTTNGIRVGIDGWVYIAMGDYGSPQAEGKDGSKLHHRGGGIVRVRQDGSEIEMYAQGTRNICDVAVDPLMNVYTLDNTNDGDGWWVRLSHIVQSGNYGYPMFYTNFADELLAPMADYGGGSPVGALYLQEPGLPKEWGDTLYMCEWGVNKIFRFPLEANGSTFKTPIQKAGDRIPLIGVERPTDIDVDGQSRMYVSSWKGATFTYNGPKAGFVLRVTDPNAKQPPFPDLKKATDDDLLKYLASPSSTYRLYSQHEILRRGNKSAFSAGLEKLMSGSEDIRARVAAVWTYKQLLGEKSRDALVKLADSDEMREHALRALTDRKKECAALDLKLFTGALNDKNARVRLQALISLGRIGKAEAGDAMIPLTADADPFISHIAINNLVELKASPAAFKALDSGDPKLRNGVSRTLSYMHEPKVVDGLIERIDKTEDPYPRQAILKALCRLFSKEADWDGKITTWWTTRPDHSGPYYAPVSWEKSDAIAAALKQALEKSDAQTKRWLLAEMARNRVELPELGALIAKLCAEDPTFKATAVGILLGRKTLSPDSLKMVAEIASSPKEETELRARAIRGLGKNVDQPGALELAFKAAASVDPMKNKELMGAVEEFERDNQKNEKHSAEIAKLAASGSDAEREVAKSVLKHLAGYQKISAKNKAIVEKAIKDLGVVHVVAKIDPNKPTIKKQKYEDVLAAAQKDPGDAVAGEQLFKDSKCIVCHTVNKSDPPKGPPLNEVTKLYKRPELIESIVKPSAKIAQGFQTNGFIMNDGTRHQGFIVKEAQDSVEIRENIDSQLTLQKSDIKKRVVVEGVSVMPDGIADELSVHELASILAYLESLNKK